MPVLPPEPGKILDALREIAAALLALDAAHPRSPLVKVAVKGVDIAIVAVEALAPRALNDPAA